MSRRWALILAAVLFIGWLSYLGYAALVKNRGPVISRAQAAAATHAIVAEVKPGPDGKPQHRVTVSEVLRGDGVNPSRDLFISNLANVQGFDGPGEYLLLLVADPRAQDHKLNADQLLTFAVMGQQRSPGHDIAGVGPPLVYRATDDVRNQFAKMPK
jgi:hypothetical protein